MRRLVLWGWTRRLLLAATMLCLAGAGWLVVTGLLVRAELVATQRALDTLRQSVTGTAPSTAPAATAATADSPTAMRAATAHADRAHRLTTGPAWYLAAHVPFIGQPFSTVRGAADATDRLTRDVLPPLLGIAPELAGDTREDGLGPMLSAVRGKAPALTRAAHVAAETRAETDRLPRDTWLPVIDQARERLARQLERIVSVTTDAAVAARVLPPMLGEDGPRRYFVVFQNTAEARGTGGLPGAFAVLAADQGRLRFERFGNDTLLEHTRPTVDLGGEYTARYGVHEATRVWGNSNLSPHFPYAARIWAATWRKHSGQRVDGVVALDPSGLGRLLRATGPARLPDGRALTAGNAVDVTLRSGYARYPDTVDRKAHFLDVARTAAATLTGALDDSRRLPALLRAAYGVLEEERLKVWSSQRDEQRLLSTRPLSGTLPQGPEPFAGLVVNNAAGSKLDYYLQRKLRWTPGRCSRDGRSVTVQITLTNQAPASGLPHYVTARVDKPAYRTWPGDNRLLVSYYASAGAQLTGAALDGRPATLASGVEHGHPVYTLDLELPAHKSRTLTLHLLEPRSDRPPILLRQPLVTPPHVSVQPYPACDD